MLWSLVKKMLFLVILTTGIAAALVHFSPKTFEDNTVQRCSSSTHGLGLCASKFLAKGSTIGFLGRVQNSKVQYSTLGDKIHQTETNTNVQTMPLFVDKGITDFYGYTTRNIEEGEELTTKKFL